MIQSVLMENLLEIGSLGVCLVVVIYIVKMFMEYMEKKDKAMEKMQETFSNKLDAAHAKCEEKITAIVDKHAARIDRNSNLLARMESK